MEIGVLTKIHPRRNQVSSRCRLLLELLNPEVDGTVLSIVSTVPENLLGTSLIGDINGVPVLALVGEVTLLGLVEADGSGTLWGSTGVRNSQTNRRDGVLNDVETLESSWDAILGGERDGTVLTAADC